MSTEARHAPVPPRPSPPPGTDPEPAPGASARTAGTRVPGPGSAAGAQPAGAGHATAGSAARRAAAAQGADPDDEPSVFTPRGRRPPAGTPARDGGPGRTAPYRRLAVPEAADPVSPPPPPASARFPDAPPPRTGREATGAAGPGRPDATGAAAATRPAHPSDPEPRRPGAPVEMPSETTTRLRPIRSAPEPQGAVQSGSAGPAGERRNAPAAAGSAGMPEPARRAAACPMAPAHPTSPPPRGAAATPEPARFRSAAAARPIVSFGRPQVFRGRTGFRVPPRAAAAAACLVLGLGLIGGAVTGTWLTGDGGDDAPGHGFTVAATRWHSVPVDQLFPPTVEGTGAGPGGADRTWTRIAVAPDTGCAHAFDPLLHKVLAPVGCRRLLRATYTDATQSYVTTVGLLFTEADPAAMSALAARFRSGHLDRRTDLMPRPYAARGTAAAGFGDAQRASWTISVLTDAPVVVYAVSGWADGRGAGVPQPAADAVRPGATTAPAQAGLGNEAQGLADRIERRLRRTTGSATGKPS